jgi:predicted dehydrogenase
MSHICIIGVGGVGKAHALAAVKYLQDKDNARITLIDKREVLEKHFRPTLAFWQNSWGPISDSVPVPDSICVRRIAIDNPRCVADILAKMNADLYIIATPNEFHEPYLHLLEGKNVLCEKPLVSYEQKFPTVTGSTHLGIEWLYHPAAGPLPTGARYLKSIEFVHAYPPAPAMWDSKYEIYDLGIHVISLYQYMTGTEHVRFRNQSQTGRVTTVDLINDFDTKLIFGYDKNAVGDSIVLNGSIRLNWVPFDDDGGDLFYRQISHIMRGQPPLLTVGQIYCGSVMLEELYMETV